MRHVAILEHPEYLRAQIIVYYQCNSMLLVVVALLISRREYESLQIQRNSSCELI